MSPKRAAETLSASAQSPHRQPNNRHASAVAFGPHRGLLILGASGRGKSSLALALITRGAQLLADDQVMLTPLEGALYARPPRSIAGLIEARGFGLLRLPHLRLARIALVVDLDRPAPPRLPAPETITILGVTLTCLSGTAEPAYAEALAHHITHFTGAESR
ncbi:HPr kinase/phosphorylase [Pararhodobacter oceanensis]|uniref:HPr kinase/phosphorylase n=1 Tax=Pararhodobacter oceanensis TaxID=2172121 RepID=UPI003A8C965B